MPVFEFRPRAGRFLFARVMLPLLFLGAGLNLCEATPIKEFTLPLTGPAEYQGITLGPDGGYWMANFAGNSISRISRTGAFTNFALPRTNNQPYRIVAGPGNDLWFTEYGANKIGRMNTNGQMVAEYAIPTATNSYPLGITAGSDGRVWFVSGGINRVWAVDGAGAFTSYSAGIAANAGLFNITTGPDGNLWFTQNQIGKIGRITTSGTVKNFALDPDCQPCDIITGPGNRLWFTEYYTGKVGCMTTNGLVDEYTLYQGATPYGLTMDRNGKVWFAEHIHSTIGYLEWYGTNAGIAELYIPSGVNANPTYILAGPDATIWFTESAARLGSIPQPTLKIIPAANHRVVLSWPANATGFQLQSNTSLTDYTTWVDVPGTPVQSGNFFYLTNVMAVAYRTNLVGTNAVIQTNAAGRNFYRLWIQ